MANRSIPSGDWATFDYNSARTGVGPTATGITAANAGHLSTRAIHIDGVADSSPIELHSIRIGRHTHDVVVVTTTYGHTIAFDPRTGAKLWEFVPRGIGALVGSSQITTASPVADPSRGAVYAASPDGFIHKLKLPNGHQLWRTRITFDPRREKIEGALNISGQYMIAATGGYDGDAPTYQGHIVLIDRSSGQIAHVFNTLCSDRHQLIDPPNSCPASDSAVWGRSGTVVEPGSGRLLIATGNGPFNGSTNWGDSALELSPDAATLLHTWTPTNQAQLNSSDGDLGSTEPAMLPGGLVAQGGKSGTIALIDMSRQGIGQTGGELQRISSPGGGEVFTTPAVLGSYMFVADDSGTTAYQLSSGRLRVAWQDGTAGTSPVIAGGLLYIYDGNDGTLRIMNPTSGKTIANLSAASGHWSSPIVVGGQVILPVGGSSADDARRGEVLVYHVRGR